MRWVALGAGVALFFLPSFLLGMVTPYSARLLIQNLPQLGPGSARSPAGPRWAPSSAPSAPPST